MRNGVIVACVSIAMSSCSMQEEALPTVIAPIALDNPLREMPTGKAWSGKTKLTMGLDTGAVQSVILFSPTARRLGKSASNKGMSRVEIPVSLREGKDALSAYVDVAGVQDAPYDGLLGWGLMRKYVWRINYPAKMQAIYDKVPAVVKSWKKIRMQAKSQYPQILDNDDKTVILDTGAPHGVYLESKLWEEAKELYPDAPLTVYSGYSPAAGGAYVRECMYVRNYKVAGMEFNNILLCESFADPAIMSKESLFDVVIGAGALKGIEAWIDGPAAVMYVRHNKKGTSASLGLFNLVGVGFLRQGEGKHTEWIARVTEWSVAWHAGLRTGDELVSVNGLRRINQTLLDYVTTQVGVHAKVVARRDKEQFEIEWVVPKMFVPAGYYRTPPAVDYVMPPSVGVGSESANTN